MKQKSQKKRTKIIENFRFSVSNNRVKVLNYKLLDFVPIV